MSGFLAVVDFLALDFLRHRGKRPCCALLGVQFFAGFLAELGAGTNLVITGTSFFELTIFRNCKATSSLLWHHQCGFDLFVFDGYEYTINHNFYTENI